MSKKQVPLNKTEVQKREERIASCKQCNGAPPTRDCNLQGLIFKVCEYCNERVGDFIKQGEPIKIKAKREIGGNFKDPNFRKVVTVETVPGKVGMDFNDLEISTEI